jgi:predicted nucleic acid-binding protein
MPLVVADTSPLFYLLSIDRIDLLPQLFGRVFIPEAVHKELCHPTAPTLVRNWALSLPSWVEVRRVAFLDDATLTPLGAGERDAIALALSLRADLILIDERKATAVALKKGFEVTGDSRRPSPRQSPRRHRSWRRHCPAQTHEFSIPPGSLGRTT